MNRRLCCTVDRRRRQRHECEPRGNIDEGTLVGRENVDEGRSHADDAAQIDVHLSRQSLKVGCRDLEVFVKHDARVVHQDIELGKIRLHSRCEGGDLRGICDVTLDGVELWVFRFHLVEHFLAATRHDDFVAEFDELERESKTDTGGTAGNDDGASSEFHRRPFVWLKLSL